MKGYKDFYNKYYFEKNSIKIDNSTNNPEVSKILYVVMPNESLNLIAQKFGIIVNQILSVNTEVKNPTIIRIFLEQVAKLFSSFRYQ
jgi:LysM repeat protein